jgi:hypothetical protein
MKEIRFLILMAASLSIPAAAMAQIGIQSLVGHKGFEFNAVYQRNFSPGSSLSYYGMLDVNASYDSIGQTQFDYYHTLTYELVGNFGLALGNSFTNDDILPHLGIYWGIENSSTDISVIPSITYSLNYGTVGLDLDLYFEKYWSKAEIWHPYSLLMANGNWFNDGYRELSLLGYLGLSYRKKVQFGFGTGISTSSADDEPFSNFGLFVSYKFE